ncbi:MAG: hypothetical protein V1793_04355 [Pseudomonadota bacterium]
MKKMMSSRQTCSSVAGLLFWLAGTCLCFAADSVMDDYLANTVHDEQLASEGALLSEAGSLGPADSLFKEMEFRFSQDKLSQDKQTFSLRVEPRGIKERVLERRGYQTSMDLYRTRREMVFRRILLDRYATLIDGIWFGELLTVKKQLLAVYRDRLTYLEEIMGSAAFDTKKYLEAHNQKREMEIETAFLEETLFFLENRVLSNLNRDTRNCFDTASLVSMKRIRQIMEDCLPECAPDNIFTRRAEIQAGLADIEFQKEKSRSWLSFIQTSWERSKNNSADESFSIELGIPLPFFDSGKDFEIKKRIQARVERTNRDLVRHEEQDRKYQAMDELLKQLDSYERFEDMCRNQKDTASETMLQQMETEDPDVLLYLKKEELESRARLIEMARSVYTAYIGMMDVLGRVSSEVPRNLLCKSGGADLW